ncbi:MAG: helix-turn-helix transcriptional regulator [Clostridia bacterium]|nr:helix-turn-helix transcriptional regulator [Clostridia bacterium]
MLYQKNTGSDSFGNSIRYYISRGFPQPHLHTSAELLVIDQGEVALTINGRSEILAPGQCALVLPNQLHSFSCTEGSRFWVHVFSQNNAPMFYGILGARTSRRARFVCGSAALDYYRAVCLIMPAFNEAKKGSFPSPSEGKLPQIKLKSALYAVLADFLAQAELIDRSAAEDSLFSRIMIYIIEHSREDITLNSVAAAFGYEPHYLCRYMKSVTDVGFRWLVNRCRIDDARQLLETTALPITEISLVSGYGCLRTFNRVFRQLEGVTPQEYRQRLSSDAGAE